VPGSVIGVLSDATWWHIGLIGFVLVHTGLFFAIAWNRGWVAARTVVLIILIPLAFWMGTVQIELNQPDSDIETEKAPVIVDTLFRDDLWALVGLAAFPADEAMHQVLGKVNQLENDELIRRLFSHHILSDKQRGHNTLRYAFEQNDIGEEELVSSFCNFFSSYFGRRRWMESIGEHNGFDFESTEYKTWLDYNDRFMEELRKLMRDTRYSEIRNTCAQESMLRELEQVKYDGNR